MKKANFEEHAKKFESKTADQADIIREERKIYHTKKEYVVKVPSNIMEDIGYTEGDSLIFTLTSTLQNNDAQLKLTIEYDPAKKKKED